MIKLMIYDLNCSRFNLCDNLNTYMSSRNEIRNYVYYNYFMGIENKLNTIQRLRMSIKQFTHIL